ncbi:hypothetical protein DXU76_04040 [Fructilactobacillus fructivorans]|nr:hypothetical protein DXU76_04040 [Fructilactobacillus fructivorans]
MKIILELYFNVYLAENIVCLTISLSGATTNLLKYGYILLGHMNFHLTIKFQTYHLNLKNYISNQKMLKLNVWMNLHLWDIEKL